MRIDAHQHFWIYNSKEYGWINDDMRILRSDFLPEELAMEQKRAGFNGSIAVQARQSLQETEWLLDLADQNSLIKGVVGWVDLQSPQVRKQLQRFCKNSKFCGVRHIIQDESDDQFMLRSDFVRGIAILKEFNLTYDILIFSKHLPIACELVQKFPEQNFVLDHMAKPFIAKKIFEPWASDIKRLAQYQNVFCKVSGMVTEADWQNWKKQDFRPYMDTVFDAFGTSRIMIGSDWPVCTVAGTYSEVIEIVQNYISSLSVAEQDAVLGNNAENFYLSDND